jgi:PAS domain S-box-containing protein
MVYSKRSIAFNVLVSMITVSAVFVALIAILWTSYQFKEYNTDIKKLRQEYLRDRKDILKHIVENAIDYIDFQRSQTSENLKISIRLRVYEANKVATAIYEKNHGKISDKEIEKKIIDTLGMMKYNKGRGYYFIIDLKGNSLLNYTNNRLDGVNILNLKDTRGKFFIREMINVVSKSGEGFVDYFWKKPSGSSSEFAKISYVKKFNPLKFFIGTGEYLKNVEDDIQQASIKCLIKLRFDNGLGYLFASKLDGSPLFTNGKITKGGPNISNLTDPDGVKIIQEQQKAAQKPQGGFVYYSWPKLGTENVQQKLSFVRQIKDWQWVIGAGLYIGDFHKVIETKHIILKNKIRRNIINFLLFLLVLILLSYLMTRHVARKIDYSFKRFIKFFENASDDSAEIDMDKLYFSEFRQLGESANNMIAARKQAEESSKTSSAALRFTEEKFKIIVENLYECVWETNRQGEIIYISPRIHAILGFSPRELLFEPIYNYIIKADRIKLKKAFLSSMRSKTPFSHVALTFISKDKRKVLIESNGALMHDKAGKIIGFRGASRDVTEQNRMSEYMRQSEKMETLGQLAGGIAHDFNNQLTGIAGYAELLKKQPVDKKHFEKYVSLILKASERASDLTEKLLAFARKGKHLLEVVDIHAILYEVISILKHSIDKRIVLEEKLKALPATTKGDPTQLQNMLLNIALNARDAITGQGEILFSTDNLSLNDEDCQKYPSLVPGNYIRIEITDNGSGIDTESIEHIFEPFFSTKEKGGTGMGLAAVYGTVKNHNGAIDVESKLGKGTSFILLLPAVEETVKKIEKSANKKVENSIDNISILIVDDDTIICDMVTEILTDIGYSVHVALNGRKALELYCKSWKSIDLVLLDMVMPEMDGKETFLEMHKINPDVRVILWSGYNVDGTAQEIIDAGCKKFIHKPFQYDELITAINQVMAE